MPRADWTGAAGGDWTAGAGSAACVGGFSPPEGKKEYARALIPNAAMIVLPAISFRRHSKLVSVSRKSLCPGDWYGSSSLVTGPRASWRRGTPRRASPGVSLTVGARGGAQDSAGWSRLL